MSIIVIMIEVARQALLRCKKQENKKSKNIEWIYKLFKSINTYERACTDKKNGQNELQLAYYRRTYSIFYIVYPIDHRFLYSLCAIYLKYYFILLWLFQLFFVPYFMIQKLLRHYMNIALSFFFLCTIHNRTQQHRKTHLCIKNRLMSF